MIPEGWHFRELRELAVVERGKFTARPRNDPKYYGGRIPFVQTGDVARSQGYLATYTQSLNDAGLAVSRVFKRGTILVTIAANIGEVAILEIDAACPDSVVAVQPLPHVDTVWLAHSILAAKESLEGYANQNAQKNINLEDLRPLSILTPPLSEQKVLASLLSTWDRGIRQLSDLIAVKLRFKQGLMQQLLTGKRRFPAYDSGWDSKPIGSFLRESRDAGTHGATAKKLTVKLYGKGVVPKSDARAGSEATRYYRRRAGQFIYSKLDFLNGAFGLIPEELDGYESTLDLPAFDISDMVDPDWFRHFVVRESFYKNLIGLANGGRKARRVNPDDLLKVSIRVPSLEEQKRISGALNLMDREISLLRKELDAFKIQKKGLMQKLLTGQVRVKLANGGE